MSDDGERVGSINILAGYIGDIGSGKTEAAMRRALELQAQYGAWILAADSQGDMYTRFHDGVPSGLVRHANIAALRLAIQSSPAGMHAIETENPQPLIEFGRTLSGATAKVIGPDDTRAAPAIVYVDEMGLWEEVEAGVKLKPYTKKFLISRRHWHIACVYGVQTANLVHYRVFHSASELHLFKTVSEKDLDRLAEAGVHRLVLDRLPNLPPFKSICFKKSMSLSEIIASASAIRPLSAKEKAKYLQDDALSPNT